MPHILSLFFLNHYTTMPSCYHCDCEMDVKYIKRMLEQDIYPRGCEACSLTEGQQRGNHMTLLVREYRYNAGLSSSPEVQLKPCEVSMFEPEDEPVCSAIKI